MITLEARNGRGMLRWDDESPVDVIEEIAQIACGVIERFVEKDAATKTIEETLLERETLYRAFTDRVEHIRITGNVITGIVKRMEGSNAENDD